MMTLKVHFYKSKEDRNHVTKTLTDDVELTCKLKDTTSILTPTITVGGLSNMSDILGDESAQKPPLNYAKIPRFDRYYYITDIRILSADMLEIDLKVDVLMSHLKKSISNTPLLASRWQGGQDAQKFVPEERLNLRTKTQLTIREFSDDIIEPSSFFILCTAGTGERPTP